MTCSVRCELSIIAEFRLEGISGGPLSCHLLKARPTSMLDETVQGLIQLNLKIAKHENPSASLVPHFSVLQPHRGFVLIYK